MKLSRIALPALLLACCFRPTLAATPPQTSPIQWFDSCVPNVIGDGIAPYTKLDTIFPQHISIGSFKIAENESPVPQDRVYVTYNYFNNVNEVSDIHREVVGFEKTFLGGKASVGVRLPFLQASYDDGFNKDQLGDISLIAKFALLNSVQPIPNLITGGVMITLPTAQEDPVNNDFRQVDPFYIQPFIGVAAQKDKFFFNAFAAVAIPTEGGMPTNFYLDLSAGCWLYQNASGACLHGIAPILELHVADPLTHRASETQFFGYHDTASVTGGLLFHFAHGVDVTAGLATPLTGPRPYDLEAILQLNFHY